MLHCAVAKDDTSAPIPGSCDSRCLNSRLWGVHEQSVLQRQVLRKEEQGHTHKSPKSRDCLRSMLTVQRGDQMESSLLLDRQKIGHVLSMKGRVAPIAGNWVVLEKILLSCYKAGVNLRADALSRGNEDKEWILGIPACQIMLKMWRTPVVDLFKSKRTFKVL